MKHLQHQFKGGLLKALKDALLPGEKIHAGLEGLSGQGIVLTDSRVIILKAGLSSGALFGQKSKGFQLQDITSVEYSCALTEGRIQITVAGSIDPGHGFRRKGQSLLDDVASSRQLENVCQFASTQKEIFKEMAALIQDRVNKTREHSTSAPKIDIAEQIRKLKELADIGAITSEEYEAKKQELLARL